MKRRSFQIQSEFGMKKVGNDGNEGVLRGKSGGFKENEE